MANRSNGLSVLSRAVRILETFTIDHPYLTLSEIASRTGTPLSSAQRIVGELVAHGLLERTPNRAYRVGTHLWEMGTRTPGALGLREIGRPYLDAVQARVHQHVQLCVRSDLDSLVIERISARDAVVNASLIGGRVPLQLSCAGIIFLAAADDEVTQRVIDRGMAPVTPSSLQTGDDLRNAVAAARRDGHVVAIGWIFEGTRSIAVPIVDNLGATLGSLMIVEPDDAGPVPPRIHLLRSAAKGMSAALARTHLPPSHPDATPGGQYRELVHSSSQSMEYLEQILPRL